MAGMAGVIVLGGSGGMSFMPRLPGLLGMPGMLGMSGIRRGFAVAFVASLPGRGMLLGGVPAAVIHRRVIDGAAPVVGVTASGVVLVSGCRGCVRSLRRSVPAVVVAAGGRRGAVLFVPAVIVPARRRLSLLLGLAERRRALAGDARLASTARQGGERNQSREYRRHGRGCRGQCPVLSKHRRASP